VICGRAPTDSPAMRPQATRLNRAPRGVVVGTPDEQEGDHEDHAEHVGEREPRLQPEERRKRHDERGPQGDRPIGVPPFQQIEHRGDGGAGQGRNERECARVIGNDAINELSRSDVDGVARRMRPMLGDVEIVEAEGKVHRVPIVEPMRPRDSEERGEAEKEQRRR
jgi:hypothetical protein